jgi:transcription elongation factor GreA
MAPILMTKAGLDDLLREKDELQKVKIPAANERLAKAREQGDLSENSEYAAAKDEREFLENRLIELVETIKNVQVTATQNAADGSVQIGSMVTVDNGKAKITYTIVGEFESRPQEKKISYKSPLGAVLMGHRAGDTVLFENGSSKSKLKIAEVK